MCDKLVISLIPTNFELIIEEYVRKWDEHIEWVRKNLKQIAKLNNDVNKSKTPLVRKSIRQTSRSAVRSTLSRQSANMLNSVMTSQTARITRSRSRLLKELNLIRDNGVVIDVNEEKMKTEMQLLDEELKEDKKSTDQDVDSNLNGLSQNDKVESEIRLESITEKQSSSSLSSENENAPANTKESKSTESGYISKKNSCSIVSADSKFTKTTSDASLDEQKICDPEHPQDDRENNEPTTDTPKESDQSIDKIHTKMQLDQSSHQMECSPVKTPLTNLPTGANDENMLTPKSYKAESVSENHDELLTDDESSIIEQQRQQSQQQSTRAPINTKTVIKNSKITCSGSRVAIKRSATTASKSTPRPAVDIKRNKTNEFATPLSMKKLSRPLNFGSATKKLLKPPTATVMKGTLTNHNASTKHSTINQVHSAKLKKPTDHLELPTSQPATSYRYLAPQSSASSISSQGSTSNLKCLASGQSISKTLPRINHNVNSESKQRCFAESALKQRLAEEKRRKLLIEKTETDDAQIKKEKLLQRRVEEMKLKREERERKARETKALEEQRKKLELQRQADEAKRLAESKRQAEEARKLEEIRIRQEEIREQEEKHRLEALKLQEQKIPQSAKKVEFKTDECDEYLQTKCFEKLEKKILEDEMKCKNTPMKQLVVEAVGKTNAERSLYKPEVDPSLDVIDLSMSSDSSVSIDEEDESLILKETTGNCTFIKDIQNKAFSSTFIKPDKTPTQTAQSQIVSSAIPSTLEKTNQPSKLVVESNQNINSTTIAQNFDSYDISDLRSDEDDEDEEHRVVSKRIPTWAKGQDFLRAIKEQFGRRSRERENQIKKLFLSIESIINLEKVFYNSARAVCKKYERRTSSACWNSPPAVHIDQSFSRFY